MNLTDRRIEEYKEAYFKYHGKYPDVRKVGAWIKIDGNPMSFRSSNLPDMANNLLDMAERKGIKEKKDVWETEKKPSKGHYLLPRNETWGLYLREDSIRLFLEKLFEKCGNSPFEMQTWLDNFALTDMRISTDNDVWDDYVYCKEENEKIIAKALRLEYEVEKQKALVSHLKLKNKSMRKDYIDFRKHHLHEMKELRKRIKHLEENSVFFSMEDMEETELGKKRSREEYKWKVDVSYDNDDIPF
jgi:hypothetical protein